MTGWSRSAAGVARPFALCLAAVLAGCASPPAGNELALTAAGRLSVRIEGAEGRPAQSQSAAFEWRGDGERGQLNLLSPLGTQVARASWVPGEAWLVTPEGRFRFDTLEALAERALGERVPLAAWPDWLAGRPWPGAPAVPLGPPAAGFTQLGWRVDLARHAEGRLEARREAPPPVLVRIVLDGDARGRP